MSISSKSLTGGYKMRWGMRWRGWYNPYIVPFGGIWCGPWRSRVRGFGFGR